MCHVALEEQVGMQVGSGLEGGLEAEAVDIVT